MHLLDYAIITGYLLALVAVGAWLARRAGESSESYFLGGRKIPWWALGSSGMASNLDVAGTMTIVTLIVLYGLHGFWIELRGGVVLPIAVFLAFMGKWHRRSQVMTTAEWMILRFGDGRAGRFARVVAALTYIILTVAMLVFFLSAGGKFLAVFLPFTEMQCSIGVAMITFAYTMVGGLYGVIWTDVFQTVLIAGAAVYVAVTAAGLVTPELLSAWPGADLNTLLPQFGTERLEPYVPLGFFLAVWMLKGVLEGLGGSGGSAYMAQRFYAAASEDDCRKIGILWTLLFAVRWPMVLGFALMAMKLGLDTRSVVAAEGVLPQVLLSDFFPPGVRGFVLAAMLAAAMSTFDSTLNAGASYVVRDLYQPWRRQAGQREIVWAGYLASALLVAIAMFFTFTLSISVLGIWTGIVMLLFPAFLVPFALRWFWMGFNGVGFTTGILGGFGAALWFSLARPEGWNEATRFLTIAGWSALACVVGTYFSRPMDAGQLQVFYKRVRPFGFWPRTWKIAHRTEHREDIGLLVIALCWQVLTFLLPMGIMLRLWDAVMPAALLWLLLSFFVMRRPRRSSV